MLNYSSLNVHPRSSYIGVYLVTADCKESFIWISLDKCRIARKRYYIASFGIKRFSFKPIVVSNMEAIFTRPFSAVLTSLENEIHWKLLDLRKDICPYFNALFFISPLDTFLICLAPVEVPLYFSPTVQLSGAGGEITFVDLIVHLRHFFDSIQWYTWNISINKHVGLQMSRSTQNTWKGKHM